MARCSLCALALLLLLPPLRVLSQDFDLADALDDNKKPTTTITTTTTTTTTTTPVPKVPVGPRAPAKPQPKPDDPNGFNLADALDPSNDNFSKDKNKSPGGTFSDSDLIDVSKDGSYKPDQGKGGGTRGDSDQINQFDNNNETTAEVGTIAGIMSAVAMALVGAISSYISYQKKKLCFGIQQSLNTDMTKAENLEGVVATEPQAQQTLLEPPNAEPPVEEKAV